MRALACRRSDERGRAAPITPPAWSGALRGALLAFAVLAWAVLFVDALATMPEVQHEEREEPGSLYETGRPWFRDVLWWNLGICTLLVVVSLEMEWLVELARRPKRDG